MKTLQGGLNAQGLRVALVVSRFNDMISSRLVDGAVDALTRAGAGEGDLCLVKVPGSFEIPLAAKRLAESRQWDAIICLGTIIRGETPHFDYVAGEASKGIAAAGVQTGVPVIYGLVTADTVEQAMDRAGLKMGNKGFDAALAAVEMVNLLKQL